MGITTHSNGHGPSGHLLDAGFRKDHTVIVQGQIQEMLEEILRDPRILSPTSTCYNIYPIHYIYHHIIYIYNSLQVSLYIYIYDYIYMYTCLHNCVIWLFSTEPIPGMHIPSVRMRPTMSAPLIPAISA